MEKQLVEQLQLAVVEMKTKYEVFLKATEAARVAGDEYQVAIDKAKLLKAQFDDQFHQELPDDTPMNVHNVRKMVR